jgi:type II secretory pathway component PulM
MIYAVIGLTLAVIYLLFWQSIFTKIHNADTNVFDEHRRYLLSLNERITKLEQRK